MSSYQADSSLDTWVRTGIAAAIISTMTPPVQIDGWPRERLAEWVSAASYGSVLILVSLALIDADEVVSGIGWELVTGVGVATWIAHFYAEVVGDHLRNPEAHEPHELRRAMADGLPILLAALLPAVMLILGRLEVLVPRTALWAAVAVALLQLVGLGVFVGWLVSGRRRYAWRYAAATATFGIAVVALMVALGH
jgi:hypothetical protein